MPIPKNKKRIAITIPKKWDRLIMKAKIYSMGESMSNSYLFKFMLIEYLFKKGYLSPEEYNNLFKEEFLDEHK